MSWTAAFVPEPRAGGPMPQPPDDGILGAAYPPGRLGVRWARLMEAMPAEARDRVARGRNHARRGRVRDLQLGPGAATAEVVAEVSAHPVVRARPLTRAEWDTVLSVLRADLGLLASLLEAELSERLLERLEAAGVALVPGRKDLAFDCDCGDFVMPCAHAAAVGHLLGDVMDGDPFQLLALRGRTREQVVAELREAWGDRSTLAPPAHDEAPPDGVDWLTSPCGVPDFACSFAADGAPVASGLRALGPVPGASDLTPALAPLYAAGGRAALLHVEGPARPPRRRARAAADAVGGGSPWAHRVEPTRPTRVEPSIVEPPAPPDPPDAADPTDPSDPSDRPELTGSPDRPAPRADQPQEPSQASPPAEASAAPSPTADGSAVLAALAEGPRTSDELAAAIGLRGYQVKQQLALLQRAGAVERIEGSRDKPRWQRAG